MFNQINKAVTADALIIILIMLFIFHILVLSGVIPNNIVWAGKFNTRKELIKLESSSLFILIIALVIVLLKAGYINIITSQIIIDVGMWILFGFFVLNTIGNLTAKSKIEKYGFGFITIIISLLSLLTALS